MQIEINEGFRRVTEALEAGRNVFLTGKAGTGKSTFLRHFIQATAKNIIVLAPTGVAALNIEGQTIHSFYGIFPHHSSEDIPEILKRKGNSLYDILSETDMIVIDEISMVRADLLDMMDTLTRRVFARQKSQKSQKKAELPFAGIQLFFIGDLYQLPPVVKQAEKEVFLTQYESIYFFSAHVYQHLTMQFYELEKIYRQKDADFIDILNRIRNGTVKDEDIEFLNARYEPNFDQGNRQYIYLTTHNAIVDEINQKKLDEIPSRGRVYKGNVSGEFADKDMPTDEDLTLKEGAQVMFLTNDSVGRWVNGTIGRVTECARDYVCVELEDGEEVDVNPYTWTSYRFEAGENNAIKKTAVGTFTQVPLRLAWSVTVHKSQGKTFSHVILDMRRGAFSTGQTYVALSRVTSIEGLVLAHKLQKSHVRVDWKIIKFMTSSQYVRAEKNQPLEEKKRLLQEALSHGKHVEIVYLKADDTKSKRIIKPTFLGQLSYQGKAFEGVVAFCTSAQEERNFRVDRILEVREAPSTSKE